MKIFLASDHAGFELKERIKNHLASKGYDIEDCGAFSFNKDDDYPDFIAQAAEGVSKNPSNMGIILGGSGQGEQITANKFRNVRCALFYGLVSPVSAVDILIRKSTDPFEIIRLSRIHNNANMLSLAARFLEQNEAVKAVDIFLNTEFSEEERHVRRIKKIKKIEESQKLFYV